MAMLAPGGRLVYSTCTWSPEENEDVVNWLLATYPNLDLVEVPKLNGMVGGIDQPETARMYPHHFQGEGQFVACLQDTRPADTAVVKSAKSNLTKQELALWQEFCKDNLRGELTGVLQTFGDQLYLLPADLPELKKLKIARNGLHLGTFKTKRFEPSFALGLALGPDQVVRSLVLTEDQFKAYASGLTLSLEEPLDRGWYLLTIFGNGLGFAKVVDQTVKNYFPKGLRFN